MNSVDVGCTGSRLVDESLKPLFRSLTRFLILRRNRTRSAYRDLKHLARRTNHNVAVTCRGKEDGGGAQLHAIMSAFAFCTTEHLRYVHTPMTRIAHGSGEDWIAKWNGFVDFRQGIDQLSPDLPVRELDSSASTSDWGKPRVVAKAHFHAYCDQHPAVYENVQEEFRRRCPYLRPTADLSVMAVHIRRGDVMINGIARRQTSLTKISVAISSLKKKRPDLFVKVYSEGIPQEFAQVPADELHLNVDVFETLEGLINAEVLLMAKSSFSYVAALLSRGIVVYEPFWHSPLPQWQNMDKLIRHSR
jgi:hypothetical protein